MIVFHDLHNHLKINNLIQADNRRIQINVINRNIVRECHRIFLLGFLILIKLVGLKIFLWMCNIAILFRVLLMILFC